MNREQITSCDKDVLADLISVEFFECRESQWEDDIYLPKIGGGMILYASKGDRRIVDKFGFTACYDPQDVNVVEAIIQMVNDMGECRFYLERDYTLKWIAVFGNDLNYAARDRNAYVAICKAALLWKMERKGEE